MKSFFIKKKTFKVYPKLINTTIPGTLPLFVPVLKLFNRAAVRSSLVVDDLTFSTVKKNGLLSVLILQSKEKSGGVKSELGRLWMDVIL